MIAYTKYTNMYHKKDSDQSVNTLSLKHFTHYTGTIQQIKTILFDRAQLKQDYSTTLISGYSGCGKSTIIKLLFDNEKYDILFVSAGSYTNILQLKNKVKYFCTFDSVLCYFDKKPKLILFDDIDIHMNNDRYFTTYLKELLKNKKDDLGYNIRCPVICIINSNTKKMHDIKTLFHNHVSFRKLSFNQCFQIVDDCVSTMTHQNDEIPIDYIKLTKLIKDNDNDLRTVLNHLHEVTEKCNDCEDELEISLKKKDPFMDSSPSELAKLLLSKDVLSNECIKQMLVRDTNQIVSMIHENYYKNFKNTSFMDKDELNLLSNLNKTFLENDLMSSSVFENVDPTLWDISLHSKLKMIDVLCSNHTTELIPSSLDFSQMINKQSLALNFNKKLVKMEQNMDIDKKTCTFPFMYIYYAISNLQPNNISKLITKNEFEIIQRFISDFMSAKKNSFSKVKTCLTK